MCCIQTRLTGDHAHLFPPHGTKPMSTRRKIGERYWMISQHATVAIGREKRLTLRKVDREQDMKALQTTVVTNSLVLLIGGKIPALYPHSSRTAEKNQERASMPLGRNAVWLPFDEKRAPKDVGRDANKRGAQNSCPSILRIRFASDRRFIYKLRTCRRQVRSATG